jgi:hypothetical protein
MNVIMDLSYVAYRTNKQKLDGREAGLVVSCRVVSCLGGVLLVWKSQVDKCPAASGGGVNLEMQ